MKLEVYGLNLPLLSKGDDLAKLIAETFELEDEDVVVVTSKAVSKVKGYVINLEKVEPSFASRVIARLVRKPAKLVEAQLLVSEGLFACIPVYEFLKDRVEFLSKDVEEAERLMAEDRSTFVMVTPDGRLASEAGLDLSNMPPGIACYPPPNPDKEALALRNRIKELTGKDVAVVITDTELSITKFGSIDIAIGCAGIRPVEKGFASKDLYGRRKYGGVDLVADELAACAALLMKQAGEGIPVVVVRGLKYEKDGDVSESRIPRDVVLKAFLKSLFYTLLVKLMLKFRRRRPGSLLRSSG